MVRNDLEGLQARLGVGQDQSVGPVATCAALHDIIRALSASMFAVRSPSFTERGLAVLLKAQNEQVTTMFVGL